MRSFTSLLILAFAVSAAAQVTKQERAGIVNFSKVDAVVACGGATETSALDGLAKDGFKSVINLRLASEANANIDLNAAHAKSLGLNYIHIPFNGEQPEPKAVEQFLGRDRQQSQSAGVRALRIGKPCRRDVDREARAAGRLDHREGDRGSEVDRPAQRTAREVRAFVHRSE